MEHRYNYMAFINDNLDSNYRYRESSFIRQLGRPSISFCSDHVELSFFHQEREDFNKVDGAPLKRRTAIRYAFALSISSQGVRLSRFSGISPKSRREEYETRVIEEIVNTAVVIMVELGKYVQ